MFGTQKFLNIQHWRDIQIHSDLTKAKTGVINETQIWVTNEINSLQLSDFEEGGHDSRSNVFKFENLRSLQIYCPTKLSLLWLKMLRLFVLGGDRARLSYSRF